MIQSVNRRHHIEIALMVVIGLALLLNVNSVMNGVGGNSHEGPSPPGQTVDLRGSAEGLVDSVANAADNVQGFTERGALDSLVSTVTAPFQSEPQATSSTEQVHRRPGGIGDWIQQSGSWLLGVISPSKETIERTVQQGQNRAWVPGSFQRAGEAFGHLSRASVSTVERPEKESKNESHITPLALTAGWY